MSDQEELSLLGAALLQSQQIESIFYGIVSNLSHLEESQKDKRFRDLTGEKFLRGSRKEFKATLGQLLEKYGDRLMIKNSRFEEFLKRRNLIVHNYYWLVHSTVTGKKETLENPKEYLIKFITDADYFLSVLRGLLQKLMISMAERDGRSEEFIPNEKNKIDMKNFHLEAEEWLKNNKTRQLDKACLVSTI